MADRPANPGSEEPLELGGSGLTISDIVVERPQVKDVADTETQAEAPRTIGKFTLIGEVGSGAFGSVWKARDQELGRTVAVKMLHAGIVTGKADRERFLREARAAAQLRHPCIVPLLEVVELEGQPAIVSAFVHGVTLRELMDVRPLQPREAAVLVADIACALDYAHSLKMVHRDVKPANIMIEFGAGASLATSLDTSSGAQTSTSGRGSTSRSVSSTVDGMSRKEGPRALLLDFGLALRDDVEATLTADGQVIGTPAYMSPEQATGDGHRVDRRTDVYSLGAVLYELLTNEQPFKGSRIATIHQVIHDMPRAPRSIVSTIPLDLETICLKAMSKSKTTRYETAYEFASDLRRWLNDEPILARRPTVIEQFQRWMRRHPALAGSLAFIGVTLTAVAIIASIAAVKFRSLADASAKARTAADEALRASEESLWQMRTAFGIQSAESNNPAQGLLWFASAADVKIPDESKQVENQIRFQNWIRSLAVPTRTLKIEDGVEPQRLVWHPSGRTLIVQTVHLGPLLWDLTKDEVIPLPGEQRLSDEMASIAAWSPDGGMLAIGSMSGRVELFDFESNERLADWRQQGPIWVMQFSDDGRLLAAGGTAVRVHDVIKLAPIGDELPHPAKLLAIKFDRLGDRIVTSCADDRARVYRIGPTFSETPQFDELVHRKNGHLNGGFGAQFSHNDRSILTLSESHDVVKRAADSGEPETTIGLAGSSVFQLTPDERTAVVFGSSIGRLVNMQTMQPFGQEMRHTNHVYDATFCRDGSAFATPSGDRTLRLWRTTDGQALKAPLWHQGDVRSAAYAPDGRSVASGQLDGLVRVWSMDSFYREIQLGGDDSFVELSPDQQFVFRGPWQSSNREETTSQAFRVATGQPEGIEKHFGAYVNGSFFAPDGRRAVTIASQPIADTTENLAEVYTNSMDRLPGQIIVWDWHTGDEPVPRVSTVSEPVGAAWSGDSKYVAVPCAAGDVLLIDANSGAVVYRNHQGTRFSPFFVTRRHVLFTADNSAFVTWADHHTRVWNLADGTLRYSVDLNSATGSQFTHDVVFSPDGRIMAVCGSDKLVRLVDVMTGEAVAPPLAHPDWIFTACFSSDGQKLITACRDGMARLWDWKSGKLVCPALAHQDEVFGVAITPDDRWLITTGRDSKARFWSATSGRPMTPPILMPHWMYEVKVTADGRYALVAGISDQLFVFDLATLLTAPQSLEPAAMKTQAEVYSGQMLLDGGAVNLTTQEWLDRWEQQTGARAEQVDFASSVDAGALKLSVLWSQLDSHAARGDWTSAVTTLQGLIAQQAIAKQPPRFRDYFDLATVQLFLQDSAGYQKSCDEMVALFEASAQDSTDRAEQLSKTILLGANGSRDVSSMVALARFAVDHGTQSPGYPWYLVAGSVAEYRAGDLAAARKHLDVFFEMLGEQRLHLSGMAFALQAMIESREGQLDAARQSLAEAHNIVMELCPQPDHGRYFGADWSDWLRCLIVVREAEAALNVAADAIDAANATVD